MSLFKSLLFVGFFMGMPGYASEILVDYKSDTKIPVELQTSLPEFIESRCAVIRGRPEDSSLVLRELESSHTFKSEDQGKRDDFYTLILHVNYAQDGYHGTQSIMELQADQYGWQSLTHDAWPCH